MGLFNTLDRPLGAALDFRALGLHGMVPARDRWQRRDLGPVDAAHGCSVPPFGVLLLRLGQPVTH